MKPSSRFTRNSADGQYRGGLLDLVLVVLVTLACAVGLKTFFIEAYRIPSTSMENTLLTGDMILVNKFAYGFRVPSSFPFVAASLDPWYVFSFHRVRRGDVVVFELPQVERNSRTMRRTVFVKRCIGVPGDTVEIRSSRVFVNGREMLDPHTFHTPGFRQTTFNRQLFPEGSGYTEWEYGPLRVPQKGDVIVPDIRTLPEWRHLVEREGMRVDVTPEGSVLIDGTVMQEYMLTKSYYFMLGDHRENSTDSRMWGFVCEDDIAGEALMVYWSSSPEDEYSGRSSAFRNIRWDRIGNLIR